MSYARKSLSEFETANPLYIGATVTFYTIDVNGVKTTTKATLYAGPTGSDLLENPQTLDGFGKLTVPAYIADPVIANIKDGQQLLDSHDTGIIYPPGRNRGVYAGATLYFPDDLITNNSTGSVYYAGLAFTSTNFAADLAAAKLVLFLAPTNLTASEAAAAASATAAATSATAAATSATAAASSATASASSASASSTSATASATSATAAAASATAAAASAAITSSGGGFANRFRNPIMDIAQRGISGTVTAGSPVYTLDGWVISCTGANVTWDQTGPALFTNYYLLNLLRITGNTSVTDTSIRQRIKAAIATTIAGQRVTFQCSFNGAGLPSNITPTLTVNRPASAADDYTSTTNLIGPVNLQTVTAGGEAVLCYTFDVSSSAAALGLEFLIDFGAALNSNAKSLSVSAFDLRYTPGIATGLNASPPYPEMRSQDIERTICEAYFLARGGVTGPLGIARATSTTAFGVFIPFTTPMTKPPTGISTATVGDLEIRDFAAADVAAVTALTFSSATNHGAFLTGTVASGLTSGNDYMLVVKTALAGNLQFTGGEL